MASIGNFDILENKINELINTIDALKNENRKMLEENLLLKDTLLNNNKKLEILENEKVKLEEEIREKNNRIDSLMQRISDNSIQNDDKPIIIESKDDIKIKIEEDKTLIKADTKIETFKPIFSKEDIDDEEKVPQTINFYLNTNKNKKD